MGGCQLVVDAHYGPDAHYYVCDYWAHIKDMVASWRYDLNLWIGHLLVGAAYLPR